jgi:hypothetical protein
VDDPRLPRAFLGAVFLIGGVAVAFGAVAFVILARTLSSTSTTPVGVGFGSLLAFGAGLLVGTAIAGALGSTSEFAAKAGIVVAVVSVSSGVIADRVAGHEAYDRAVIVGSVVSVVVLLGVFAVLVKLGALLGRQVRLDIMSTPRPPGDEEPRAL